MYYLPGQHFQRFNQRLNKSKPLQLLASLALSLLITLYPLPALANTDFEQQVLDVIRNNPEVILESVQAYQNQQQQQVKATQQAFAQELMAQPDEIVGSSPRTNDLTNRAVLLEFSDFECPYCAKARDTVKAFVAKHPDQVTLVYKHLPLSSIHTQALPAASAAYAAQQQGQFWAYHDALFDHQDQLGEEFYLETAQALNLDIEQFNRDRTQSTDTIQKDIDMAFKLGLRGTPFFVFQGQTFSGVVPVDELEKLL